MNTDTNFQERLSLSVNIVMAGFTRGAWRGILRESIPCQCLSVVTCVERSSQVMSTWKNTTEDFMDWVIDKYIDSVHNCRVSVVFGELTDPPKQLHISGKSEAVQCPHCAKTMMRKNMHRHITVKHTNIEPSGCNICQKICVQQASVKCGKSQVLDWNSSKI